MDGWMVRQESGRFWGPLPSLCKRVREASFDKKEILNLEERGPCRLTDSWWAMQCCSGLWWNLATSGQWSVVTLVVPVSRRRPPGVPRPLECCPLVVLMPLLSLGLPPPERGEWAQCNKFRETSTNQRRSWTPEPKFQSFTSCRRERTDTCTQRETSSSHLSHRNPRPGQAAAWTLVPVTSTLVLDDSACIGQPKRGGGRGTTVINHHHGAHPARARAPTCVPTAQRGKEAKQSSEATL